MNPLIAVLAFAALEGSPQDQADGPMANYTPEAIAGARKLHDAMAGTIWSYHYRTRQYDLGFNRSGDVQLLEGWKSVRWRVAGPRRVILESANGQHMVLRFDTSLRHFWTKDWDGRKATGRQTERRMAGEAAVAPRKTVVGRKYAEPVVDLRDEFERRRIAVRNQKQRGSCQVFAFVGVLEYQLSRPDAPVDLSEQFLMWAANDANGLARTEGFNPDLLVSGLKKRGICNEALMPYVPENEPIDEPSTKALHDALQRADSAVTSIKHWSSTIGFTDEHVQAIRKHLDAGMPVTVTLCWPEGLKASEMVNAHNVLIDRAVDGKSKGGHGVVLCGYGLDKLAPGGGYFLLRNSWGPDFAKRGYARVTFDYAKQYGIDAYIASIRPAQTSSEDSPG